MESSYTVREYVKADWPMVSEWWAAHDSSRALVEAMLPPLGVVVECDGAPEAACWVYLSAGVGVAMLESPVSKPGLPLAEAMKVFGLALGAIEAACLALDYGVLFAYTLPGIGRVLQRRHGFAWGGPRVQLMKGLR